MVVTKSFNILNAMGCFCLYFIHSVIEICVLYTLTLEVFIEEITYIFDYLE